ncbi:hypothetical protein NECAME_17424, partial [Necator americanus]
MTDLALSDCLKSRQNGCPIGFSGDSCEVPAPLPLSLATHQDQRTSMVIVFAAVLLALFTIVFMNFYTITPIKGFDGHVFKLIVN